MSVTSSERCDQELEAAGALAVRVLSLFTAASLAVFRQHCPDVKD